MKQLVSVVLILLSWLHSGAQSSYHERVDSLESLLQQESKEDQLYVDRLIQLGKAYQRVMPDSMSTVVKRAVSISNVLDYKKGILEANKLLGLIKERNYLYQEALSYYHLLKRSALELEDDHLYANSLMDIGRVHSIQEQYDSANSYLNQSLDLHSEMNNFRQIGVVQHEFAIMAYFQARYDNAIERFLESLEYFQRVNDQEHIASVRTRTYPEFIR